MTTLIFSFRGELMVESCITIVEADLAYFADAISEELKATMSVTPAPESVEIALDIHDFSNVSIETLRTAVRAYQRVFVHRSALPRGVSGIYPSESINTVEEAVKNMSWPSRNAFLVITHYLGDENLFKMACRIYVECLAGLTTEEIREAIGHSESDDVPITPHQSAQLREVLLGETPDSKSF